MSNSCWEKTSHVLTKGQNLKVNIKIEQEEQKLRVIQDWGGNKSTYFVRERRLDSLMREFLDFSFELGLICLIRHNHPRPKQREKGTEYIGFSRRPDERWIYVIDQYSKKT